MKKRLILLTTVAVAALAVTGLAACGDSEPLTDEPLTGETIADFTGGAADTFFASDGWSNGGSFNVTWDSNNAVYQDEALKLSITKAASGAKVPYLAGEVRTYSHYGYGDYSVKMKPAKIAGTASTFFTYTGPSEKDENGNPCPHDEIDIEFLGKDTSKVQFNYFVNGKGGHEHMYNLGFDASKEYHEYGFRWTAEYIVWFVDSKPVYKVKASKSNPLPSTPGRILMNHWSGTSKSEGWMGKYKSGSEGSADYKFVKTSAAPVGDTPEKPDIPSGTIDWSGITAETLTYTASDEKYKLTNNGTATDVTYSGITCTYANFTADVTEKAADKNWVHVTLRNNATDGTMPTVRINVLGEKDANLNYYATMNGKEVTTDHTWGGSYYNNIPAGADTEAVVYYKGVAKSLQFMVDSTHSDNATAEYAGNITVSNVKFAKLGEIEQPVTPPAPTDKTVTVNGAELDFVGNVGAEEYTLDIDAEKDTVTATYTDIAGSTYKNINADVSAIARTHNTFTAKIKNSGAASATVRVDVNSLKKVNNTVACNVSGTVDGAAASTDTDWGGTTFAVAAGATVELSVVYDTSRGPTTVMFYFDSLADNTDKRSGSITVSEMAFTGEGSYDPDAPDTPEPPAGDGAALTFTSTEEYTVDKSGEAATSVNVTYTAVKGATYKNIQSAAAELAAGKNTFSVTIKNNGTESVSVRVDLIGERKVTVGDNSNMECCNLSATATGGTGLYTDTTWGGTKIVVAAGETVTVTITYSNDGGSGAVQRVQIYLDSANSEDSADTNYAGNVTISAFKFSAVAAEA